MAVEYTEAVEVACQQVKASEVVDQVYTVCAAGLEDHITSETRNDRSTKLVNLILY